MANEINKEVVYKVRLDDSDLSEQLQNIRSQIDTGIANISLSTPTNFTPSQFSQPIEFSNVFATSMGQMGNGFNTLQGSVAYGFQNTQSAFSTAFQTLSNTANNLMPSDPSMSILQGQGTGISNLMGAYGFGYNPDLPMSRRDYELVAQRNLRYTLPGTVGGTAGGLLGMVSGNPFIALGGSIVGSAVGGAGMRMMFSDTIQDLQASDYINYMSSVRGTLMNDRPGNEAAQRLRQFTTSYDAIVQGVSRREAEDVLTQFTNAGGFDTARTTDEYMRRFNSVLEDHKKIMHTLRVTQEQAVQFMGELEKNSLVGSNGIFGSYQAASLALAGLGASVGLTGGAVGQYGLQSVSAGTSMIPGLDTGTAFIGGMASLINAQAGARQGLYSNDYLARMGGVRGIASAMQGSAYEYANSSLGRMNLLTGGIRNIYDLPGETINRLNSFEDIIRFQLGYDLPTQIADRGVNNINLDRLQGSLSHYGQFFERNSDGKYSRSQAEMMLMLSGVDRNTATGIVGLAGTQNQSVSDLTITASQAEIADYFANRPSTLDEISARFQEKLTGFTSFAKVMTGGALTGATLGATVGAVGGLPGAALGALLGGIVGGAGSAIYYGTSTPLERQRQYDNVVRNISNIGRDRSFDVTGDGLLVLAELGSNSELAAKVELVKAEARKNLTSVRPVSGTGFSFLGATPTITDSDVNSYLTDQRENLVTTVTKQLSSIQKNYPSIDSSTAEKILTGQYVPPGIISALGKTQVESWQQQYKVFGAAISGIGSENLITAMLREAGLAKDKEVKLNNIDQIVQETPELSKAYAGLSGNALLSAITADAVTSGGKWSAELMEGRRKRTELLQRAGLDNSLLASLQTQIAFGSEDSKANTLVLSSQLEGDNLSRAVLLAIQEGNVDMKSLLEGRKAIKTVVVEDDETKSLFFK